MTAAGPSPQDFTPNTYCFGRFVLDLERSRLMRDGEDVKLRPKSFELLRYLVRHHGRVVTKEELIKIVWPDAFVTDDSLVQCVRDIRRALEDDEQRLLKNLPRRGYIFEVYSDANGNGASADVDAADRETPPVTTNEQVPVVEPAPAPIEPRPLVSLRAVPRRWLWIGFGLIALVAAASFVWYPWMKTESPRWKAIPLTSYRGVERNPALSPDGNAVAFTWDGGKQDNFDIYIQGIGSSRAQRLTTDVAEDTSPEWSPDGRIIAFLRRLDAERNQLILIPAVGGPEHVLTETRNRIIGGTAVSSIRQNLAWTPDGQWIAVPHQESSDSPYGLYLVSVPTGSKRPLTQPPGGYFDENPAFSPDGRTLAFARLFSKSLSNLHVQTLSKDFVPTGQVQALTTDGQASHPAWTADGRLMYLWGTANGRLRIIGQSGHSETAPIQDEIGEFSLGRHLIYTHLAGGDNNVWRAEVPSQDAPPSVPQRFISSTRGDRNPAYSFNGKEIGFLSGRSGSTQIWIADAGGTQAFQLTSLDSSPLFPQWSPDGQRFLFHRRIGGQAADLFTISVNGGQPKRLTSDPSEDLLASYSRDGNWIYFTSKRSGAWEIWKMPADGGEQTRLTFTANALQPLESPDGKNVFYIQEGSELTIWKIPSGGGTATQVTGPIAKDPAFAVGTAGIYYKIPAESPPGQLIQFLSFSTGQSRPVVVTEHEIGLGLSLSPDERYLIFALREGPGSDLMLIKDFLAR